MKKIVKFAQSVVRPQLIQPDIQDNDDPAIIASFKKTANHLKEIAPKAKDFLYFSCIMMHAAESSALDENGNIRKTATGENVEVGWDVLPNGALVWKTNDQSIKPFRNNNCFIPGTKIVLADGSEKNIETVLVGDEVITHLGRIRKVTEVFNHSNNSQIYTIKTFSGKELKVTSEHPFLVLNNADSSKTLWVSVKDLVLGSTLLSLKDNTKEVDVQQSATEFYDLDPVVEIIVNDYIGPVHNFEVEEDHSYIANGLAVHNSDIFPRKELKLAYKKWVGKPLCLDHQSSSVDHVRGIIVDTVYDDKRDRIIALCAVDKVNYPDLARKIATGYSASVSMGTAVGKAICTEAGCHAVARYEHEFCQHMRTKNAYGEINVDLNPIELSIVVNPADPGAKIRRVIASAKAVEGDTKLTEEELKDKISELNVELTSAVNELQDLEKSNLPYRSPEEMVSDDSIEEAKDSLQGFKTIEPVIAEAEAAINVLRKNLAIINKMASDKEDLNKSEKDLKMKDKKSYLLGTEEPKLGAQTYTPEALDRDNDKQLVGDFDLGPVDGMKSSDIEKKKQTQRFAAQLEGARVRREAALAKAKTAYLLGGEEPKLGKQTYTPDPLGEKTRKEDKQMVGNKPFPDTGKVDELFPGDKEKKEMTARASYQARFVKAASQADSRWDVYDITSSKPVLVLTATVAELAGDARRVPALYGAIATKEYGSQIVSTVKSAGVSGAAKIFKAAQAAPAPVQEAPVEPLPELPEETEPVSTGATGTPKEKISQIAEELNNLHADLVEAANALDEEGGATAPVEQLPPELAATASLKRKLAGQLTEGFKQAIARAKDLKGEFDLIEVISAKGVKSSEAAQYNALVSEAISEASELKRDAFILNKSFYKYAESAVAIAKKAQAVQPVGTKGVGDAFKSRNTDSNLQYSGTKGNTDVYTDVALEGKGTISDGVRPENLKNRKVTTEDGSTADIHEGLAGHDWTPKDTTPAPAPEYDDIFTADQANADDKEKKELKDPFGAFEAAEKAEKAKKESAPKKDKASANDGCDEQDADVTVDESGAIKGAPEDVSKVLSAKARMRAARAKLAQKAVPYADILRDAHPSGTTLDIETKGDGAKVETLEEVQKAMLDIATAAPKVKEAAEKIHKMVVAGRIDPSKDFPGLIAEGLDATAVAYYKKFFGEAEGASDFVTNLVKDHESKKTASEKAVEKVKMARAFELAWEMKDKGLIRKADIQKQVEKIMCSDDHSFDMMKTTVASLKSEVPVDTLKTTEVGFSDSLLRTASSKVAPAFEGDLKSEFELILGRK